MLTHSLSVQIWSKVLFINLWYPSEQCFISIVSLSDIKQFDVKLKLNICSLIMYEM